MIKVNIKIDTDQIVEIGKCLIQECCNVVTIIEVTLWEEILGEYKIIEAFQRGRSRSGGTQYSGNFRRNEQSSSRSISDLRASTNRDRIRCSKCRDHDHFAKDYPNISDTEKEQSEQIQQMLNLEQDKTALMVLAANTYNGLIRTNPDEPIDHLN